MPLYMQAINKRPQELQEIEEIQDDPEFQEPESPLHKLYVSSLMQLIQHRKEGSIEVREEERTLRPYSWD